MKKTLMTLTALLSMGVAMNAANILRVSVRTVMRPNQTLKMELDHYGEKVYDVDSLVVSGTLTANDFPEMSKLCQIGALKGIDLSGSTVDDRSIPVYAFLPRMVNGDGEYKSRLEYISLPSNIDSIGERAFSTTSLKSIEISRGVEKIGNGIFEGCDQLQHVVVRQLRPTDKLGYELNSLPEGATVSIPTGTAALYEASEGWKGVRNLKESDTAFRIHSVHVGEGGLQSAWDDACGRADSLVLTGRLSGADFKSLKSHITNGRVTGLNLEGCTVEDNMIPSSAFQRVKNLWYVTLPAGIDSIGVRAFRFSGLRQIVLPASVKSLDVEAFARCTEMTGDIRIPEGMRKMAHDCFFGCYKVKNIYVPSTLDSVSESTLNISLPGEGKPVCDLYVNRMTPPTFYLYDSDGEVLYGGPLAYDGQAEWALSGWKLYVPVGAKKNFENAQYWCDIPEIIETPELTGGVTAVKPIHAVDDKGLTEVYTLGGRLVSKGRDLPRGLAKGLYVVKTDGKTQKMLINE